MCTTKKRLKSIAKFSFFIILFSIFSLAAYAISMQGGRPSFTYEKGFQKDYSFIIGGAPKIRASLEGSLPNLTKYVSLIDPDPDGGQRTVTLRFNMYEDFPPGRYQAVLRAVEIVELEGTITARTGMRGVVDILVLFPGKYLEWSTSAKSLNVNETSKISITATSLGTERIDSIYGKIDVYNEKNELLSTVYTEKSSLESDTSKTISADFDSTGLEKGNYHYDATLYWDSNVSGPKSGQFRIGSLEVYIRDYTKAFFIEAISPFSVVVESDWSGVIEGVYAKIQTPNEELITPTISLDKFKRGTMKTFWDTRGLGKGVFNGTITVFYQEKQSSENVQLYVNMTEPKAQKEGLLEGLSTTTIVLIIVIILLVANFVFFYIKGLRKK